MALQLAYNSDFGTNFPQAYYKIVHLDLDYLTNQGTISVSIYQDSLSTNLSPVSQQRITLLDPNFTNTFGISNLQTQDPLKAAYTYLATLSQFSKAVSV